MVWESFDGCGILANRMHRWTPSVFLLLKHLPSTLDALLFVLLEFFIYMANTLTSTSFQDGWWFTLFSLLTLVILTGSFSYGILILILANL